MASVTPPPHTAVILVHEELESPGLLIPALRRAGFVPEERLGTRREEDAEADLLVVMGGSMRASQLESSAQLGAEVSLLERRLESRRPTLGIGLGAQLLAAAAGAPVMPGERGPVVGVLPLTLTPSGLADPLFAGFEERFEVVQWQADTFGPVPGATHLASSARYPQQAFRLGNALGLQFHPELDVAAFKKWVHARPEALTQVGRNPDELLSRDAQRLRTAEQHLTLLVERLARFFAREVGAGTGERYLFTVQSIQRLGGPGVVLSPGIPRRTPIVRVGEPIWLQRPDGSRLDGTVRGMASFGDTGGAIPLLVQLEQADADIPAGSEVHTSALPFQ
jgi:GMP synthase (glutamine-hydrolysing)